jgi:DNA-directed RNA polymerase subunit N (RpoN/RPB10)
MSVHRQTTLPLIRCPSCGSDDISFAYKPYKSRVKAMEQTVTPNDLYYTKDLAEPSYKARILTDLGISRDCCKLHLLTSL